MVNAHQIARACREPGFTPPSPEAPPPPAFMTVPTTCARAAVRMVHRSSGADARKYLADSTVGDWANHTNKSMASGANAVLAGLDWYVTSNTADARNIKALDQKANVTLGAVPVDVRIDVILEDGDDLAGRVVLWDGPDFKLEDSPVIASAFALALPVLYPGRSFTTVGVWQARRQRLVEVAYEDACGAANAAAAVVAAM